MTAGGTAIRVLGRLSIDREGAPGAAVFPGRRSELVFAHLAVEHHRDVSRDELADALWPQELPDAWAAALRSVVSDVRRVIAASGLDAGELLEHTGGGYRLRLPPDGRLDLDEARSALAAARARLRDEPAAAAASAARAAELARMPFLPRHEGDWVDGVRRELERILVEALELSARAGLSTGDHRAAAAAAARLVEAEPYSEAAHRLRIEVLAAGGDRAGAQRAFEECRDTFREELGVEISDEIREALHRALAPAPDAHRPSGTMPADSAPRLASASVLVVDDHDFQRRTALALLGRLGVGSLAEACDGVEALELLGRTAPPDVIVCDVDMPGMDGVEFIRHVAERGLASAVVIVSGLDRSVLQAVEAVGQGYGLQVLGVVEKPLTTRRLSELLAGYRPPPSARAGDAPAARTDVELRAALDDGRIGVSFAPIVDLQVGAVTGASAVATWQDGAGREPHVVKDPVGAELAARLTDHVLTGACRQLREIAGRDRDMTIWVAVAGEALTDVARVDRLLAIVRGGDADPRRIVFRIAERAVRHSSPAELEMLTRLRVKGFGICLDDYGGGHVSDDALSRIPLTAVAIAAGLVRGAAREPARIAAVEDALDAIRTLGLPAVASGCDEPSDYELLLQMGCHHAEGEIIGGPEAPAVFADRASGSRAPSIADRSA
ncbi:MAG TPA: EAL domain-containing protein [Solirubrobacteraceae bacterium]|jgi:DNA-binding SARP family transcriptional activator/EAL domain-containing protein (putative c-di-GMP-specific phosphodiesterase class I)|nr:EAL domain-containing protein [Solirubrobacteraceae bacterium]